MSLSIKLESIFTCPMDSCRFKIKKFDSIAALNMHLSKKHLSGKKIVLDDDGHAFFRLK